MKTATTITCQYCYGDGTWETECCNGSGGCSCRGQRVDMGPCNVCNGTGRVDPENYDMEANLKMISGACFIGSGPRGGWLPGSVSLGIGSNDLPF
jgi:hypothetical protein